MGDLRSGNQLVSPLLEARRKEVQNAIAAVKALVPEGQELAGLDLEEIRALLVSGLSANTEGLIPATEKGAVNGVATLDSEGHIPLSQLVGASTIAITDVFVVANEAEMLALVAERGDIAVRSDITKSFILKGNDATVLADWAELLAPTAAGVFEVFGRPGPAVVAQDGDYTAAQVANVPAGSLTAVNVQAALNALDTRLVGHDHTALHRHYFSGNSAPASTNGEAVGMYVVPADMTIQGGQLISMAPPSGAVSFNLMVGTDVVALAVIPTGGTDATVSVVAGSLTSGDVLEVKQVNTEAHLGKVAWSFEGHTA